MKAIRLRSIVGAAAATARARAGAPSSPSPSPSTVGRRPVQSARLGRLRGGGGAFLAQRVGGATGVGLHPPTSRDAMHPGRAAASLAGKPRAHVAARLPPRFPSLRRLPSLPRLRCLPSLPRLPSLPCLPSLPGLPSLGSLASLPRAAGGGCTCASVSCSAAHCSARCARGRLGPLASAPLPPSCRLPLDSCLVYQLVKLPDKLLGEGKGVEGGEGEGEGKGVDGGGGEGEGKGGGVRTGMSMWLHSAIDPQPF